MAFLVLDAGACATGVSTDGPGSDGTDDAAPGRSDAAFFDGASGDSAPFDTGLSEGGGDDATQNPEGGDDGPAPEASSHDASQPDASSPDSSDASAPETGGDAGDASVLGQPAVGDIVITEVMFDPSGTEPQSEWLELYNLTSAAKILSGLTLQDGLPRTHVIASSPQVVVPPHAYVVLARDRATAIANLVPSAAIVYEYGTGLSSSQGILLANGTGGAVSIWNGGTELASVPYGPWGMDSNGHGIELKPLAYAGSTMQANWCLAQSPWTSGSDDGTPGAASDCP